MAASSKAINETKVINYVAESYDPKEPAKFKTYLGRYYVLMVLSFLAIHQNITWMTFGTVPEEAYEAFHLSNEQITILSGTVL